MAFELETERLTLRLRQPADADWSLELLREHEGGTAFELEQVASRLAERSRSSHENGIGLLAIRRRSDDVPIGYCGLIIGRTTVDEPEIAYELRREYHGHGYATEAARVVVEAAFLTGRTRIWSTVGEWNTASLRVLEKVGFLRHHTTIHDGKPVVYLVREA